MKRKSLLYLTSLLILAGCDYNDKYFDGLDEMVKPGDVKTVEYTLVDADYASIAKDKANITLAENMEAAGTVGIVNELAQLGTTKRFSERLTAIDFVPAFLKSSKKWYTADNGSAVKVTYNNYAKLPEYVQKLNTTQLYEVTAEDYASIWGAGSTTNFFTPSKPALTNIPTILLAAKPDAVSGDIFAVDYNESDEEPSDGGGAVALDEKFSSIETGTGKVVELEGWHNVTTKGTFSWEGRAYSGNSYINASANKHTDGELDIYLITPKFKVDEGMKLTFDACYGYYKEAGGRLSVLVSSDLAGFTPTEIEAAEWEDISSSFEIEIPSGNFGTLSPVGAHNMDKYVGKEIYLAFKYSGNGDPAVDATTTIQVDNIAVKGDNYVATTGLFQFDGTAWNIYEDAYMLTLTDFQAMGSKLDYFSSTMVPENYLPAFLKQKYPYAQVDSKAALVYKYSSSSGISIIADHYVYSGTEWIKDTGVTTDQFVLTDDGWKYDPSIVIMLKPGRSQPEVSKYYQTIVDYVGDTFGKGYFQGTYTNAEYYYGASAYQNNISFEKAKWRTDHANAAEYEDLTDDELQALMDKRITEAFIPALKKYHSDLAPAAVEVRCTVYFGIYVGTSISEVTHVIAYRVKAPGEFEYIENSYKALQ